MRKILITLLIVFASGSFYGQTVFDQFDGQEEIVSVIVNKKMFELMSKVKVDASDKETLQYLKLIQNLDDLRVFSTTNSTAAKKMRDVADSYIKSASLEELKKVNENGKQVTIDVKRAGNNNQLKEFVMFIDDDANGINRSVLMSLTGVFSLNDIPILTDKMQIPGGTELKKLTQK
ncbi:hypothetical protein B6A10_04590 [Flavobacterium sp. L1I52]|uniref:DUF4252 domain-containing protein n=1 Tax=Flavobacterium pokkalii TaxID=1940408 RepID=A0ABR7UNW9_9FLAO|nr:DUF4252 domain-containing protein [Flavobacterium pokkalii]KQB40129.1 DUF4252 domain containing protein [Flavobacterium daejeonense]MBD0724450.1 hypothetical protein [Flavobacterium pokkalii]